MSHSIDLKINRQTDYSFRLGMNIWDDILEFFSAHYSDRKLFIAIDSKVHALHGAVIKKECTRYFEDCHFIEIPEGEKSKSVSQWKKLQDELLENGIERSTPLLAVGGGVAGDLAGFVAATVLRGISLIHMPTTLLAMVDSSIGGKTGINHPAGKNLIGAFYQPDAVFADVKFLETLERREWIGGLAEMLKYAAIRHPAMVDELEHAVQDGFQPSEEWVGLIKKSAATKIDIVEKDIRESGKRAYLNFGHTFGHALEKLLGYGNISHGEAVFTGMLAALHLSAQLGAPVEKVRFAPFLSLYDVDLPGDTIIPKLIEAMGHDKKVKDEIIRLVLLRDWGVPYLKNFEDSAALDSAWQAALGAHNKTKM